MSGEVITLTQAAALANRSKTVVRRWVLEGWLDLEQKVPGRNGAWLLNKADFENKLPLILTEMESRTGGRNHRAPDALGNERTPRVKRRPSEIVESETV